MNTVKFLNEPIRPDYAGYLETQRKLGNDPMSEDDYLTHIKKTNERRAARCAVEDERIRKANHLLFRTKNECTCGGAILHKYRYMEAGYTGGEVVIGPGPDNYGEDADPTKPKTHDCYYCKTCGVRYEKLTKATRRREQEEVPTLELEDGDGPMVASDLSGFNGDEDATGE